MQKIKMTFCIVKPVLFFVLSFAPLFAVQSYVPRQSDPMLEPWRWQHFPELNGRGFKCFAEDHDGSMWFGVQDGVMHYDGLTWTLYTPDSGLVDAPVVDICITHDHRVLAATRSGIGCFEDGQWSVLFPRDPPIKWACGQLEEDAAGRIWCQMNIYRPIAGGDELYKTVPNRHGILCIEDSSLIYYTTTTDQTFIRKMFPYVTTVCAPEKTWGTHSWDRSSGLVTQGDRVFYVFPGGAADSAGLELGDKILDIQDGDVNFVGLIISHKDKVHLTVQKYNSDEIIEVNLKIENLPGQFYPFNVFGFSPGRDGRLWMAGYRCVLRLDPTLAATDSESAWDVFPLENWYTGVIHQIIELRDGRVIAASERYNEGVCLFDGHHWKLYHLFQEKLHNLHRSVLEMPNGDLCLGGMNELHIQHQGKWRTYGDQDARIPSSQILMLAASDGSLWLGGQNNDVYRVDYLTDRWQTYEDLNFQCEIDGTQWFISVDGKVISFNGSTWYSYSTEDGLMDAVVALCRTKHGLLWAIGSHQGYAATAVFRESHWIRQQHDTLSWGIDYRGFIELANHQIWFGAAIDYQIEQGELGGVLIYDPALGAPEDGKAWSHREFINENFNHTYGFAQTPDGRIWSGGIRFHLYDKESASYVLYPEIFASTRVDAIAHDANGDLYVGTRGYGLFYYHQDFWKQYTLGSGLSGESVNQILCAEDQSVWVATDKAISRFHPEYQTWITRALPKELTIAREAGSIKQSADGAIWINHNARSWYKRALTGLEASSDVFPKFRTVRFTLETDPPETQITLWQEKVSQPGNSIVKWAATDLWNVTSRQLVEFSYKLDDAPWSDFTLEEDHIFLNLKPGKHQLQVRARDKDFNIDPSPAVVHFSVVPPVYQEPWFVVMISFFLIVIAVAIFQIIIRDQRLVQSNTELKKATEALVRSNQSLTEFAYVASHDLQEPLRKVIAFGDRLSAKYANIIDERGQDYLRRMQNAAIRMQELISGLLAYSRVTTKTQSFVKVDLNEIVQNVIADLEIRINQHKAHVEIGDLPVVQADPLQMRQLFQNLIGNALKFLKPNVPPVVRIFMNGYGRKFVGERPDYFHIHIRDNGIGFKEEYAERIFGVFQRLHGKDIYEGTGIGLSVCKKIVERHEGEIVAIGHPGEGAEFVISLPKSHSVDA